MADLTDNLVDLVRAYITPDLVDKAATFLGENRGSTEKAVNTAIPALLSVFAKFAGSGDGSSKLFDLIQKSDGGDLLSMAASLFTSNHATDGKISAGNSMLDTLLGSNKSGFIDSIAQSVGIKNSSIGSLLSLIGPFILSFFRKQVSALGLNADGFGRLLADQSGSFTRLLPSGVSSFLANLPTAIKELSGLWKWLLPLLLLLGALLLTIAGLRGCDGDSVQTQAGKIGRALSSIELPGGIKLTVPQGGFDYKLVEFLKNPADQGVPRSFVFDDLNFHFGTSNLTHESKKTVDDLIVILKAFPTTEARLEGHTDNVGDAAVNLKVSKDRANLVKDMLVAAGISSSRLSTDGFGQDRPIDTNATDAGRAKNRRTELVVTKK